MGVSGSAGAPWRASGARNTQNPLPPSPGGRRGARLGKGDRGKGFRDGRAKPISMGRTTSSLPLCHALNASLNSYPCPLI